jgi:hypothetical protein
MHRLRTHLTYANVAATLALVVAVAGGTTAIAMKATAPKNSVTSKSIRPFNVTAKDLTGLVEVTAKNSFNDPQPSDGIFGGTTAVASCPPGTRVLTGGGFVDNVHAHLAGSQPINEGWSVSASGDGTNEARVTSFAWCLAKNAQKPSP